MDTYWIVLALSALPALGNILGGLLAEAVHISGRGLSLALHAAAGVILAVVGVELIPQALQAAPSWVIILSFVSGGIFFVLIDRAIDLVQSRLLGDGQSSTPWAIFFGVALDLFSDGIMIGTGTTVALSLGLLLALGQVSADLPEGFATIAAFKRQGIARRTRLLLSFSFAIPIFLGATLGYWIVRGQPQVFKLALLTFTAGILTTLVVEEIVPEAHRGEEARLAALVFVAGFALFAGLSLFF